MNRLASCWTITIYRHGHTAFSVSWWPLPLSRWHIPVKPRSQLSPKEIRWTAHLGRLQVVRFGRVS